MSNKDSVFVPGIGVGTTLDTSRRLATEEEVEAARDRLRDAFYLMCGYAGKEGLEMCKALKSKRFREPWGVKPGTASKVADRFQKYVTAYEEALSAYNKMKVIQSPSDDGVDVAKVVLS